MGGYSPSRTSPCSKGSAEVRKNSVRSRREGDASSVHKGKNGKERRPSEGPRPDPAYLLAMIETLVSIGGATLALTGGGIAH